MKYTKESLQNTWGVVESKEHAEFIIELAVELGCSDYSNIDLSKAKTFVFDKFCDVKLYEADPRYLHKGGLKQITIPLPPKAKEWPQVGDDALMMSGKCKIVALADKHGNLAVTNEFGFNLIVNKSEVKKPKSKEDILIEELQTKLCNNNYVDNFTLASDIINGMIPGLSYNSVIARAVKIVINKNLDGDD